MRKIIFLLAIFIFTITATDFSYSQMRTIVSVTGSVFNQITKDPIRVKYKVVNEKGKTITRGKTNASQNGYYFITGLKPGNKYKMIFDKNDGYFKANYTIDIPNTNKYAEFSRDFLVPPKYQGLEIPQMVSTFEINKTKLRGGSEFFLSDVVEMLKGNPTVKFTIVAYPDNAKDEAVNKSITDVRCKALYDFFTSNGISPDRIALDPHSSTDPKNPPPTKKRAKGKRYIGPIYYKIDSF